MKKISLLQKCFLISISILFCNFYINAQNTFPSTGSAGIGTTSPVTSSILEMVSTSQGMLTPRMTKVQRDAIYKPVTGLLIYQTNNTPGFYYYTGSAWTAVTPKAKGWSLTGNNGTNPATNFIGTNDAVDFVARTNNVERMRITSAGNMGIGTITAFGQFTVAATTNSLTRGIWTAQYSTTNGGAVIGGRRSRGTELSPLAVGSGDYGGGFISQNYDGSNYLINGNIGYRITGAVTGGTIPGEWYFAASTATDNDPYVNGTVRMVVQSTGNVGIGTTSPTHLLQLNADDAAKPSTSTWTISSDARLKTNISDFEEGLDAVKKIHPVWFEYNGKAGLPKGIRSVGILAEEMQKVAPYMIGKYKYSDSIGNTTEYLDYNANALFYILVNSVKELSAKNDQLKTTISSQQGQMDELKTMVQTLQQSFNSCNPCSNSNLLQSSKIISVTGASLEQNIPNPFSNTTTINYSLPPNFVSAQIIITDKSGKVLKQINVSGNSKGFVQVNAATLSAGAYQYALLVDGKLIDTKQMELLK
jgi:trimeric autotransporter adhesin